MRLPERGGLCVVAFGMDGAEESVGPEIILGDGVTRATPRSAVTFLPSETRSLRLRLFGPGAQGGQPIISITTVSYAAAALSVCLRQPWQAGRAVIRAALRGGPPKMLGQLRRDVGCMAARSGGTGCYTVWSQSFDLWPLAAIERLMRSSRRAAWPSIAAFVFHTSGSSEAALRASLAALDHGPISVPRQIVGSGVALTGAVADSSAEYVALLQAGEILPAHALPLLADHAVALGRPDILYADEDAITADDRRHSPIFKPQPSRLLMLSGTLSRGVWLVRRGLLVGASPGAGAWAETARLDAWLRLHESGRGEHSHRIPHVLTHRRADTDAAPADALAGIARQHVARTGFPVQINPGDPLRLRVTVPRERQPKVSIIVPSACRGAHVAACLDTVLARTDYADYEIILTVAGRLPLDDQQNRILSRLAGDGRVHPLVLRMDRFNYAAANNAAAREASGDFICLLNDDVAPLHDGWLATLVGHLADPQIGVVGAKLLYPDRTIQHAGDRAVPGGCRRACASFPGARRSRLCEPCHSQSAGFSRDRRLPAHPAKPVRSSWRDG